MSNHCLCVVCFPNIDSFGISFSFSPLAFSKIVIVLDIYHFFPPEVLIWLAVQLLLDICIIFSFAFILFSQRSELCCRSGQWGRNSVLCHLPALTPSSLRRPQTRRNTRWDRTDDKTQYLWNDHPLSPRKTHTLCVINSVYRRRSTSLRATK